MLFATPVTFPRPWQQARRGENAEPQTSSLRNLFLLVEGSDFIIPSFQKLRAMEIRLQYSFLWFCVEVSTLSEEEQFYVQLVLSCESPRHFRRVLGTLCFIQTRGLHLRDNLCPVGLAVILFYSICGVSRHIHNAPWQAWNCIAWSWAYPKQKSWTVDKHSVFSEGLVVSSWLHFEHHMEVVRIRMCKPIRVCLCPSLKKKGAVLRNLLTQNPSPQLWLHLHLLFPLKCCLLHLHNSSSTAPLILAENMVAN